MQHNTFDNQQITVVFQGSINPDLLGSGNIDGSDFLYNVAVTKKALPNASIILSTWETLVLPEHYDSAEKLGVDKLILNPDPGGLPNIKFGYDVPNNVNRQIISTQAGLQQVTTAYAVKLRTDSYLINDSVVQFYAYYSHQVKNSAKGSLQDYSPIVVPNFFTIDPTMYEHMAFHISDWAQFGSVERLTAYWSLPLMTHADATYFERHAHDADARFADNAFRTRLAVEQHLATHFAQALGYTVPKQYNEMTAEILADHNAFLASQIIILDMADYGLSLPKYAWVLDDDFMATNCINHDEWYRSFYDHWYPNQVDQTRLIHAEERSNIKRELSQTFMNDTSVKQNQLVARLYPR